MRAYKTSKIVFDLVSSEINKEFKVDKILVNLSISLKKPDGSVIVDNVALDEIEVKQFNYLRKNYQNFDLIECRCDDDTVEKHKFKT
jgi:hypothetical protein